MSKIIIGIHGMGNKPEHRLLEKWWKSAILEGLGKKEYFFLMQFKLVYWASILHPRPYNLYCLDKKDPLCLKEPYHKKVNHSEPEARSEFRKKIRDHFNEQLDRIFIEKDGSPNFNHISDFMVRHLAKDLHVYFKELADINGENPRDRICRELAEVLYKNRKKEIFLIAHSMGSIIAWDVLTKYVPDVKIHTLVTIGSPLGIPIVRSRILSEINMKNNKKPVLETPGNIQYKWYNLSDFKDRVAISYDLKSDFLPNSRQVQPEDMLVYNNYEHEGDANHHKSYGYLRCKEMSGLIYRFLKSRKEGNFFTRKWKINYPAR